MRGYDGHDRDHGCNENACGHVLRLGCGNDSNGDRGAPTQELHAAAVLRRTQTGSRQDKAMQQTFGLRELASQILSKQVVANLTESRGILLQVVASRQSLLRGSWQNSHTPHNAIGQHSSLSQYPRHSLKV